ncbi:hypothetical protein WMY93_022538 [Mugilogobius chulae]|uniref:Uncharacterized protein n=1 Tax=Mugilogobius chulae TaxID=88201 RepID=A0AAW0N784_9GOBI
MKDEPVEQSIKLEEEQLLVTSPTPVLHVRRSDQVTRLKKSGASNKRKCSCKSLFLRPTVCVLRQKNQFKPSPKCETQTLKETPSTPLTRTMMKTGELLSVVQLQKTHVYPPKTSLDLRRVTPCTMKTRLNELRGRYTSALFVEDTWD